MSNLSPGNSMNNENPFPENLFPYNNYNNETNSAGNRLRMNLKPGNNSHVENKETRLTFAPTSDALVYNANGPLSFHQGLKNSTSRQWRQRRNMYANMYNGENIGPPSNLSDPRHSYKVSLENNSAHIAGEIFSKYNTKQNMISNVENDPLFKKYIDDYTNILTNRGYSDSDSFRFSYAYYYELLASTKNRIEAMARNLEGGFFVNRKKTRSACSACKAKKPKKTRKKRRNN